MHLDRMKENEDQAKPQGNLLNHKEKKAFLSQREHRWMQEEFSRLTREFIVEKSSYLRGIE